ncbi:hypothetical protein [Streptomyces sp. NBC_00654]|uniref:hypothetical protein n=1 Tax=Streptomyces sp. NBC_00654 TaxID=2975799 RepID=UPI00224FD693|nr:hypothetical protein [Streptomyces sp. NBC_00654]
MRSDPAMLELASNLDPGENSTAVDCAASVPSAAAVPADANTAPAAAVPEYQ